MQPSTAPDRALLGQQLFLDGDRAGLLKPGAAVFAVALKKADGSLAASRVAADKDGIKPPM